MFYSAMLTVVCLAIRAGIGMWQCSTNTAEWTSKDHIPLILFLRVSIDEELGGEGTVTNAIFKFITG